MGNGKKVKKSADAADDAIEIEIPPKFEIPPKTLTRSEDELIKSAIRKFAVEGLPPEVILNESDECKEEALDFSNDPKERVAYYKGCLVRKLDGEKRKKYF